MNRVFYNWDYLMEDIDAFVEHVKKHSIKFTGVYGLPRGGLIPAVILSHRLDIPLLMAPSDGCIIVDDIADSGRSLVHYTENDTQFNKYYIMTLFYASRSVVHPDYYSRIKKENDWVEFPWEVE